MIHGYKNKSGRKNCILCKNMGGASRPAGWIAAPDSGVEMGICYRHLVSLCRTPKMAETDGGDYHTAGSWRLVKCGVRYRWFPILHMEFEVKGCGWRQRSDKKGKQVWLYEPVENELEKPNWTLLTGTHGKLPNLYKDPRDLKPLPEWC